MFVHTLVFTTEHKQNVVLGETFKAPYKWYQKWFCQCEYAIFSCLAGRALKERLWVRSLAECHHKGLPWLLCLPTWGHLGLPWLAVILIMDDTHYNNFPVWPPWSLLKGIPGYLVQKQPFSAGLVGIWSTQWSFLQNAQLPNVILALRIVQHLKE